MAAVFELSLFAIHRRVLCLTVLPRSPLLLRQLHGDFNRILDTKIDAILTSDLNSGKEDARAKRKALSAKCGTIIEEIEGLVKAYDAQRSAAKSV